MEEFPSNSKGPAKPKNVKVVEQVTTGEVIVQKKPLKERFRHIFLGPDMSGTITYVFGDVLLPALRDMFVDVTTKGIERRVYGEHAPRARYARPRTPYGNPPNRPQRRSQMLPDQPPFRGKIAAQEQRPNFEDIILVSTEEVENVVLKLHALIEDWDVATVSDFRHLVGLPSTFVDNNWGWTDLSDVDAQPVKGGYLIDMPLPEALK